MSDTLDPKLIDKRIVARHIKKGLLSEKDYEKHLKSLPDLADNAVPFESRLEPVQIGRAGGRAKEEEEEE